MYGVSQGGMYGVSWHVWGQSKNIVYGVSQKILTSVYGVSQKILTERSWEPCYPDATFTENRI